jgi:hypothetical protein
MAALPYKVIAWQPYELMTEDKMNQDAYNVQWLYENTPRILYTSPSINRPTGIKLVSGRLRFDKKNADTAEATVSFGGYFSTGCQPNITTGIISNGQRKIHVVLSGISQLYPNENGFRTRIEIAAESKKNDKIQSVFWVNWMAMGY